MSELEKLKAIVKTFCEDRDWDQFHSPKDLAIGLVTEAAELLEIFRFKSPQEIQALLDEPKEREKIADELADAFYFILRFSQLYGFNLASELETKLEKNAKKYPVSKARGSNKKYTEFE